MEFGLISIGNHAINRIIPAIIDSGNRVSAVYSSDRTKGEKVSGSLGAEFFDSIDKLLSYDVDAVYISSPNFLHYEYAKKSLLSGKDVLLEKPVTLDINHSIELANISKREGRKLNIGFHLRFHPGIQKVRDIVRRGGIGKPIAVYGKWTHLSSHSIPSNSWWGIPEQAGGGSVVGTGVHVMDSFVYTFGSNIKSVWAKNFPHCTVIEESFYINIYYENGFLANSFSSRKVPSMGNDMIVIGEKSVLRLVNAYDTSVNSVLYDGNKEVERYEKGYNMYVEEIKEFSGNGHNIADANDGVISTKLHLLSQRSACEDRELEFPASDSGQ